MIEGEVAVLLDVDGTLLDTREFIFQAYEYALSANGFAVLERAAGVKTVGVTYGFGGEDIALAKPDYVIEGIAELVDIVTRGLR